MTAETMNPALANFANLIHAKVGIEPPLIPSASPTVGQTRDEWLADVEAARAEGDRLAGIVAEHLGLSAADVAAVEERPIPVQGTTVNSRVYIPHGQGPFPGLVYLHGGAWWLAGGARGFALNDSHCRMLCAEGKTVVVTVDYRLAPEFPFPIQLEDAFQAVAWVQRADNEFGIDPSKVSVAGTSSGGNLAAAVCLLARDRGGPKIQSQILHVPVLDLTLQSDSVHEDPETARHLEAVIDLYVTSRQRDQPTVSPLLAADLRNLPPAFIATGRYDPLRDDGRRYAERLLAEGTEAAWIEYSMFHGIGLPETLNAMYSDMAAVLRTFHA
jgi:acetyl esterase